MRLSTGDQNETIRMEDVVFTLNNIVDDISKVYAGSFDDVLLDSSPMEIDSNQLDPKSESQQELNPPTRPDSPTHSEPPISARSTASSDSEDTPSLYSPSSGSSCASTGFRTPSLSPTSRTFVTDKDTINLDPVSMHPFAADGNWPLVSGIVQNETGPLLDFAHRVDTVPVIKSESISNSNLVPWKPSLAADSNSFTGLGSSPSSGWGGVEIIYQTSTSSPVFLSAPSDPMPGVNPLHLTRVPKLPPRPRHPQGSPPHLPALRSPTSPSTPRLDQNEDWDTGSYMTPNELGAAHLVRQRQYARMTITHASLLAEPQDIPPCRPVDKYVEWGSYSPSSISPPRKRILGAISRRVHIGPRMLPRGEWDPERKGGLIDRWNYREALRRERTRTYEDTEQDSRRKLKPVVPLWINTSGDYGKGSDTKCEDATGDDVSVSPAHGEGSTLGNEDFKQEHGIVEGNQDTMRLCVKDGERVLSNTSANASSNSRPQSKPESSGTAETTLVLEHSVDATPDTMRWCVKNGVRVPSPAKNPTPDSKTELETSTGIVVPVDVEAHIAPRNPQNTALFDQKRTNAGRPYAPKKRSPLSRTLLPVSSATMRFQLRTPGDVLSVGRARRKFASMLF
ncbi:unnamed protein product [Rhizoctonia solani]|uniref:Uncharacterized protein n=1 Tax=Rhizoctonia solani TaxID=456999 RepID=A0A8H3DC60_9AGAM|nr:unnamed protein product [Rhizoctonia solani]